MGHCPHLGLRCRGGVNGGTFRIQNLEDISVGAAAIDVHDAFGDQSQNSIRDSRLPSVYWLFDSGERVARWQSER